MDILQGSFGSVELTSTARNPIPGGATVGALAARDGLKLRYALWPTTARERRGTVCLFTGRSEFIEKYFETVTDLRRRGFAVAMMDWRGQGGSGRMLSNPRKGYVKSFAQYDSDLAKFMNEVVLPDCPAPYFGVAHSMGGHILLRSTLTKMCWFDRIVLCAPMIAAAKERSSYEGAGHLANFLRLFGLGGLYVPGGSDDGGERVAWENNPLTSDPVRFQRTVEIIQSQPSLGLGSPTLSWAAAAARSIRYINSHRFLTSVKAPLLIVGAGNDRVVSMRSTELFASRVKICKLVVIAGARHEIFQERDALRDQLWAAFDAFIPGSNRMSSETPLGV
jgi:lysophospholipase